jgi:PAS domain S-box-containing protein
VADLGRLSLAGARPTDLLAAATELIVAELGVEFAEVLELDPTDGSVRVAASAGWQPSAAIATIDSEIDATTQAVLEAGRPVIVPDWSLEARFKQPQALAAAGIVSSVQVGLRSRAGQRLEGVLGVHSSSQRIFSDDEVVFLDSIAIHLAQSCCARRAEEEFRALVDNGVDVVARLDRTMRHVYVNPAIEGVLGVPADALIGKTIFELGIPESLTRMWELTLRRAWQSGREQATEFRLTTAGGERMFRSRVIPELAPDGSVEFVLTVWRDVTEQHLAELERADLYRDLRAGQQQLQELVAGFVNEHERELQRAVDVVQLEQLTAQERNVLQLVAKGWTNRQIGARLGRTPGTVKNYVAAILSKLNVTDRTQAAVRAVELGLVDRTLSEDPNTAATAG